MYYVWNEEYLKVFCENLSLRSSSFATSPHWTRTWTSSTFRRDKTATSYSFSIFPQGKKRSDRDGSFARLIVLRCRLWRLSYLTPHQTHLNLQQINRTNVNHSIASQKLNRFITKRSRQSSLITLKMEPFKTTPGVCAVATAGTILNK